MFRITLAGTLLLLVSLTGCREDSVNIDAVTNHACIHAEYGPFEMVTAGSAGTMPDVSSAHTAFVIDLSGSESQVVYQTDEEAPHVFFTNKPGSWTLSDQDGELTPFTEQDPSETCEYFTGAVGFDLSPGITYILDFEETQHDSVTLITEAVDG